MNEKLNDNIQYDHYFLSYSGAKLPLNLVSPITPEEIENRNTFFGACVDENGKVVLIHKRVYGDIELVHRYAYDDEGQLQWAEIINVDDEANKLWFDADGNITRQEQLDL